jgi:hypothetical protein
MRWPQSFDSVHEEIWRGKERGFLVMINGNKIPRYDGACRELYRERLRAIEYFGRTGEIDLYGIGWNGPSFKVGAAFVPGTFEKLPMPATVNVIGHQLRTWWQRVFPDRYLAAAQKVYRGVAASKAQTLGRYKFGVCFENSVLKGWITEKIFDCFFAGTVPVYWGAPDIRDCVPGECFIDMREFNDYADLRRFLTSLASPEIDRYRERAREFLDSPAYEPFTRQAFARIFARIVEEDAEQGISDPVASLAIV